MEMDQTGKLAALNAKQRGDLAIARLDDGEAVTDSALGLCHEAFVTSVRRQTAMLILHFAAACASCRRRSQSQSSGSALPSPAQVLFKMPRIETEIRLDFKDVLIRPKRSTLKSRSQVDVSRRFTFRNSKQEWHGVVRYIPFMLW